MKSVVAFLLLIGISCQIGLGNCAPADQTLYDQAKGVMDTSVEYIKSAMSTMAGYMPNMSNIAKDLPSVKVPESVKEEYQEVKDDMGYMKNGVEETAKDTINDVEEAIDYV